jgi:hypothetical protein
MRHQVVELAGDAGPFVEHGLAGDALLLGGDRGESGGLFGGEAHAVAGAVAERDRGADGEHVERESAAFGSQDAIWYETNSATTVTTANDGGRAAPGAR